ncbi:(d)CMP kinase [Candidatus Aerophobetes bacterium]|uniref:Cytidylate kinase n=1 Tax=Aerophobetes bacterium TaxID=2030807 RepID=A0A523WC41_UNCAE|nr:MAG: (d)CMP kinase [Candidatus Aerophobetes bacterium]
MKSLCGNSKQLSLLSRKRVVITIDGPAASGKSTAARLLAKKLGYLYLDTGTMYRALTWKALRDKVDIKNPKALSDLARNTRIFLKPESDLNIRIYLDGKDVTSSIRSPEVNNYVSLVSAAGGLREVMVAQQREIANRGSLIAEGRDMGTVVFPEADAKIFLEASFQERAKRRWKENKEKGLSITREEVETELANRDRIDSQRKISPLKRAKEALVIDNSHMDIPQTVEKMWEIVTKKMKC